MMRVSAKQLNLFGTRIRKPGSIGGCPRAWAGWYLENVRPAYTPESLAFGIRFHTVCASLVETGRMPEGEDPDGKLGKMGRAALLHLPIKLKPNWLIEQTWLFQWTTTSGLTVEVDLRPDVCADGTLVDLLDWKSTSHKRYTLTTLLDDVQANLYAVGIMKHFDRDSVLARWVYVEKSESYRSWPIDCVFPRQRTEEWLHWNVDATIELIHTLREMKPSALDLPGDGEACDNVGRFCDYSGFCLGASGPKPSRLITLAEIARHKEGK